jgi:hypothetical protein
LKQQQMSASSAKDPLLGRVSVNKRQVFETVWWRFIHAFAFVLGGAMFTAGSALLLKPSLSMVDADAVGLTYTIGSLGFLTVDVLEFFTFTSPRVSLLCAQRSRLTC